MITSMRLYLSVLLCIALVSPAISQSREKRENFNSFFEVGRDLISAPAYFSEKQWITTGSTLLLTAAAFPLDEPVRSFALDNQTRFLDHLFEIDKYYHIEGAAISIAALFVYGNAADNRHAKNLTVRLTEATLYSGIINLVSKAIIGRERPALGGSAYVYHPFSLSWERTSLPSGHTTLSFAYSTVMAKEFNNFFWKFGWYTAAGLVGLARIYHNAHWLSDVILGAAIGYFVGVFVNEHDSNNDSGTGKKPVIINLAFPLR